jgi:hypothetical protein
MPTSHLERIARFSAKCINHDLHRRALWSNRAALRMLCNLGRHELPDYPRMKNFSSPGLDSKLLRLIDRRRPNHRSITA